MDFTRRNFLALAGGLILVPKYGRIYRPNKIILATKAREFNEIMLLHEKSLSKYLYFTEDFPELMDTLWPKLGSHNNFDWFLKPETFPTLTAPELRAEIQRAIDSAGATKRKGDSSW